MSRLPAQEVERIARLARLRLTAEEREELARELPSILEHLEAIRAREGDDPPELPEGGTGDRDETAPASTDLRPDRVDPDALRRAPADLAPAWEDGHFVLPRLAALDGDDGADGDRPGDEG